MQKKAQQKPAELEIKPYLITIQPVELKIQFKRLLRAWETFHGRIVNPVHVRDLAYFADDYFKQNFGDK